MHQIWVIVNDLGVIKHCWEAPDPPVRDRPNDPPFILEPLMEGWKIIKVKAPGLLEEFRKEAQAAGKTLSRFILDECQIDEAARPERPEGLPSGVEFREIKRKEGLKGG